MRGALAGAGGGLAATVPMTLVMLAIHRRLPAHERYAIPPRRVTRRLADIRRIAPRSSQAITATSYAAHFGFGAAAGAAYGALQGRLAWNPLLKGMSYGMLVWAGSYMGWLAAAGLHPPATREPAGRNVMMVTAHVAWGAVLGLVTDALLRPVREGACRGGRRRHLPKVPTKSG